MEVIGRMVMEVIGEVSTGAAVLCLGALAWLLGGRHYGVRRARLLLAGGPVVATGPPAWPQALLDPRRWRGRWGAEWAALGAGLVIALWGASVIPVVVGAAGVPVLRRVRLARQARDARERRADAVIALCGVVAGLLNVALLESNANRDHSIGVSSLALFPAAHQGLASSLVDNVRARRQGHAAGHQASHNEKIISHFCSYDVNELVRKRE
ncbi:hypothetical protein AB0A67_39890, partial [Streptomyces eurythermus]